MRVLRSFTSQVRVFVNNDLGEDVNFNEFAMKKINSLKDVAEIGTLGTLRLSSQEMEKGKRCLMTFEGVDRIRIENQLQESDFSSIFEENREHRITKLKKRLDMLRRFQTSSQSQDFYDNKEIEDLERELEELDKKKVNQDEMLETFAETNLRIVEYTSIPRELFHGNQILANLVKVENFQSNFYRKFGLFLRTWNKIQI